MIRCPNCRHEELPGALFCSECGARLIFGGAQDRESTRVVKREEVGVPASRAEVASRPVPGKPPRPEGEAAVTLFLLEADVKLPLVEREEFTLGRVTEGQPLIPEIDLSPYGAYEQGVSRLHAVISIHEGGVTITDLGSANGTWLNGVRITPHTPQPLKHGDFVTLGKLKLRALIR